MKFRRKRVEEQDSRLASDREERLVHAEKRANVLFARAEWLHTVVTRRDQENHWQDSVNRLFLGGNR